MKSALALLIPLGLAPGDRAVAQDRVLVLVEDSADHAGLRDRLRGQLNDIESVEVAELSPSTYPAALDGDDFADVLGGVPDSLTSSRRIVVWFTIAGLSSPRPAIMIYVLSSSDRRALVNELRADPDSDESAAQRWSALLEQTSLFVRGTIAALLDGGQIGVETLASNVRDVRSEIATARPQESTSRGRSSSSGVHSAPRSQAVQSALLLGLWSAVDGQSRGGQRGFEAGLMLRFGIWMAGLQVSFALPSTSEDALTTLRITTHGIDAIVGAEHRARHGLRPAAGLSVGTALVRRSTVAQREGLVPRAPSWQTSLRFGPHVSLGWQPLRSTRFAVLLGFTLDIVPKPVSFVYGPGIAAPSRSLWKVQPRLGLGLRIAL